MKFPIIALLIGFTTILGVAYSCGVGKLSGALDADDGTDVFRWQGKWYRYLD